LTALLAGAALAGVGYGLLALDRDKSIARAIWKMIPAALLAVAAWYAGAPALLTIGLLLAMAGDGFLAFDGQRPFLAGLASFLVCHLCYAGLFLSEQDPAWTSGPVFLAGTALIFAVALGAFRYLRPALAEMRIPVALYSGVIAAMAVAGLSRGPDPALVGGVALFMASDLALAIRTFRLTPESGWRPAFDRFVWFSYLASQLLIVGALILR
jgi:uncharacterized membrane protein YhhN